ncbi:MAG TPA: cysteine-rich CWC family protein [Burkholderiaceae bacterium]|nr:cysteine-rich CWC family protein [Burkholderiaceae bacterium]
MAAGTATYCSACGRPMVCGRNDPAGCWCARLPPLPAGTIFAGQSCLCETCLRDRAVDSSTVGKNSSPATS